MAWSRCIKNAKLLKCIIHKVTTSRHFGWCWAHQSLICFCLLFNWGFVDCSVRSSVLGSCMGVLTCTYFIHNKVLSIISALFFNPNLGFLPGSIWIWKKYQNLVFQVLCHLACSCGAFSVAIIFFYLVMKFWETFFMLNFIYFHFQIAIVKVLYEIRLLSGKSYWKYGCKWRWFVRSLNWCVDSGKLWILDIEVINIFTLNFEPI
jgi:hypothetical protein